MSLYICFCYRNIYIYYINIYFTVRKVTIFLILQISSISFASFQCNLYNFGKLSMPLLLSDNWGGWYMIVGNQYFWSKWFTSVQVMTPLHGGAANGLKSTTHSHCFWSKQTVVNLNSLIHTHKTHTKHGNRHLGCQNWVIISKSSVGLWLCQVWIQIKDCFNRNELETSYRGSGSSMECWFILV